MEKCPVHVLTYYYKVNVFIRIAGFWRLSVIIHLLISAVLERGRVGRSNLPVANVH